MIKRLSFLTRRDGMSPEDFRTYWLGHHAAILKGMPHVLHYSVSCFEDGGELYFDEGGRQQVDGFAALWFESNEDMAAAYASPAGLAAAKDIANFAKAVKRVVIDETTFVERPGK
jgi:uncharacterized protein (TIGR02118 family)